MRKTIDKFINDGNLKGLYFLQFPTGFGKSYEVVQYIANYYKKLEEGRHIFFITTNLNNLPINDFKQALGENWEKDCIVVKSYRNTILENFNMTLLPKEIQAETSVIQLNLAIQYYNSLKQNNSYDNYTNSIMMENALKHLEECEKEFRYFVHKYVQKLYNGSLDDDEAYKAQKLYEALKEKENEWIGKLYPNIFVKDYPIIIMSVKKFLTINDPFYENKYEFYNGAIIENAIIFIDEIDATKDTINSHLIDAANNYIPDFIQFVDRIASQVLNYKNHVTNIVDNAISKHLYDFISVVKKAIRLKDEFQINLKYYCEGITGRNFLFNDATYHLIFDVENNNHPIVKYNEEKNNMTIHLNYDKDDNEDIIPLLRVIRAMNTFLYKFKNVSQSIASDYQKNKNEQKGKGDLLSEKDALCSFYNVLNISQEDIRFLINQFDFQIKRLQKKHKEIRMNNSYYDRGFKYFEFTNKMYNSEATEFTYTSIPVSAELILLTLAQRAKVIGMSATATINSVLCNYSLKYLEARLGNNLHFIDEEDLNRIKEQYSLQNKKYKSESNPNGTIEINIQKVFKEIKSKGEGVLNMLNVIYNDPLNIDEINRIFIDDGANDYFITRYLSIAYVFKEFVCHDTIQSFLCLNNALPNNDSNLKPKILEDLFERIIIENKIQINENYFEYIKSGSTFDKEKAAILKRLENGDRIFLMSSYATLGAGQNLQYKLTDKIENKDTIVNLNDEDSINEKDPRNHTKDFDAIYLGDITHIITDLSSNMKEFNTENLLKYVIEIENLYENEEISYDDLIHSIYNVFQKIKKPAANCLNNISGSTYPSKIGYVTKQAIQAIGRLNRTFNKRNKIHIYISKTIYDYFDETIENKEICSPEIIALCHYLNRERGSIELDKYNYQAEHISYQAKNFIYELLSDTWTKVKVDYWKSLRDYVLTDPIASISKHEQDFICMDYYINKPDMSNFNSYYYYETNDFSEVKIIFSDDAPLVLNGARRKECSASSARLEDILKYEGMREHFESKGYKTEFKKNQFMLSPVLFNNIYKGGLGEVAGKFILEKELNIKLEELESELFELFDFKLCEGVYIDFKHWRNNSFINKDQHLNKIERKLKEANGKKAFIINLLDEVEDHRIIESHQGSIVEVPYLINPKDSRANVEVIEMLRKELVG